MIITLIIIYWIASSILSYYLIRRDYVGSEYMVWNNFTRIGALATAGLMGTYFWLIILVCYGISKIAETNWGKREAKW